jgi:hypothetical protein
MAGMGGSVDGLSPCETHRLFVTELMGFAGTLNPSYGLFYQLAQCDSPPLTFLKDVVWRPLFRMLTLAH